MRQIAGRPLWIGHAGDGRGLRAIHVAEIQAVIDLALNEPPVSVTRELTYGRFPLLDGAGNPPWLLRAAVHTVAALLRERVPTLVFCGAGMSRSPAVAAVALSLALDLAPIDALDLVTRGGPGDVSAALWNELLAAARS